MKTVWISALNKSAARVEAVAATLRKYGLQPAGHAWTDDPAKLAWRAAADAFEAARADLWLILAEPAELALPSVRYGLSLFAAVLRQRRGVDVPTAVLWQGAPAAALPPLLDGALVLDETSAWAAKIVARVNKAAAPVASDFRFAVLGDERLGQWFEIGPRSGDWDGVVFGIAGADARIDFQAVGPAGGLPEKTVLEFAQQGLTLEAGEQAFDAWAVRNWIDAGSSCYVRVNGCPEAVLFMPYAEDGDADATVLRLC
ncbi:hypothetical protein C7405_113119 [Paraburkholderia caballeronis]|uniref:hypothetical protein n=1 Tax=Paraburkholderia caballeronis TaxID=416943 RepID=UPI0010658089|nr:hypothetical protein [Paraburkholderia caballeronis]TDV28727.1 hypothetical protein C7405_113119 [Paraburkholderia caballeronis]